MEGSERDNTQDWLLPEEAAPPLLSELESRIDEALIVAKASEKAAIEIGDAALDAAAQARRAADLAERASEAALSASAAPAAPLAPASDEDPDLRSFSERADRVVARLRALERLPIGRG
ncbi:MAG TPA: hypothetical protein VFX85_04655 [Solirubrobacterales bacterium]|nr:hypothetical protein [Solirubrobacterales bacterium]